MIFLMVCFDLNLFISGQVCSWLDNDVFWTRTLYFCTGSNKTKGFQHLPEGVRAFDRPRAHLSDSTDSPVGNAVWSDITTLHITTKQRVTPLLSGASDQGGVGQRSSEVAENKNKSVFETDDGQFFSLSHSKCYQRQQKRHVATMATAW